MIDWQEELKYMQQRRDITEKLKKILVDTLSLDISPEYIQEDQPIFGRGLELDSIDALELSMHITKEFGIEISDDDMAVWGSVNKLADYILDNK